MRGADQPLESLSWEFTFAADHFEKTGSRTSPLAFDRSLRNTLHFRNLAVGQSTEKLQYEDARAVRILHFQALEHFVDQHDPVVGLDREIDVLDVDALHALPAFQGRFDPRALDQDLPHLHGDHPEKMCPAIPGAPTFAGNPQPSFVNQCRCLERVSRTLCPHPRGRETPQFVIDEGQQFFGRQLTVRTSGLQDPRDVTLHKCGYTLHWTMLKAIEKEDLSTAPEPGRDTPEHVGPG